MMKKQGFTLAEVLITLTIIGVIATMTLPALMTNTQEQQAKTGLKKGINTLTEVAQMHEAIEGYNYSTLDMESKVSAITTEDADSGENTIRSLAGTLRERAKIDVAKTMEYAAAGNTKQIKIGAPTTAPTVTNEQVVYFNDGSAIIFGDEAVSDTIKYAADQLPIGYTVVYDTNGLKGPNKLSNCLGKLEGAYDGADLADGGEYDGTDAAECETKNKRVIHDQFTLRLRGNVVEPDGAAATWAFGK